MVEPKKRDLIRGKFSHHAERHKILELTEDNLEIIIMSLIFAENTLMLNTFHLPNIAILIMELCYQTIKVASEASASSLKLKAARSGLILPFSSSTSWPDSVRLAHHVIYTLGFLSGDSSGHLPWIPRKPIPLIVSGSRLTYWQCYIIMVWPCCCFQSGIMGI